MLRDIIFGTGISRISRTLKGSFVIDPKKENFYLQSITENRSGINLDVLRKALEKFIPTTNHQNIMTDVEVIDIDSDTFLGGHYHLTAIIKVTCRGHYMPEIWDSVSGIYRIRINPNPTSEASQVSVELLTGKILATGKID